jgi:endonuclease YncB( thermonuclease family)
MNCQEMDCQAGLEAKLFVSNIIDQQICTFESLYLDKYGRTVAIVTVGSNDLGAMITNAGQGVVMEKYKIKGK